MLLIYLWELSGNKPKLHFFSMDKQNFIKYAISLYTKIVAPKIIVNLKNNGTIKGFLIRNIYIIIYKRKKIINKTK